jgi:hypothetical protein
MPATPVVSECFLIAIDYAQKLAQMIVAGMYDWDHDDLIAANFPLEGQGTVMAQVLHLPAHPDLTSEDESGVRSFF